MDFIRIRYFKSVSVIGLFLVNVNILAPKIGAIFLEKDFNSCD
jgi:hypothetical protein